MKVCVLLSTYNGAEYLEEQLDSILAQTGVEVDILVRDDGSTDSTKEILQRYQDRGALNVIWGENIGWRDSFMELVYNAPASDYYAFCDQDDIWLPEKLNVAVDALENKKREADIPLLYGSNLFCYRDGKIEGTLNLNANFTKQSSLLRALTCGCTLVYNKALFDLLRQNRPKYVEAHDSWVFMVAMYLGGVIYDPNAYILYRQHGSNQIGANLSILERIKRGCRTIKKIGKEQSKSKAAKEFLCVFNAYLSETDKLIISKFANYNTGLIPKFKLLLDSRFSIGGGISELFLKLKILTNTI